MKLGQSIEYNMRNNFFEKSCTKCDRKTEKKKSNLSISLDQQFEVPYSLLLMYVQLPKYIETKVLLAICFFYFIQNVFFKKRGLAP